MLPSYKPELSVAMALMALIVAPASTAETEISSVVNVYHPRTVCELIADIEAANVNSPAIVDLGGNVFELEDDCYTAAGLCPGAPPPTQTGCYANTTGYAFGPTGLPEIIGNVTVINGRIVRGTGANEAFRIFTVTTSTGELSLFKITLENGDAEPVTPDTGNGGAVYVDHSSSLELLSSKIGFNKAADSGGGIYVASGGVLGVQFSIISHNTAKASNPLNPKGGGGGIYLADAAGFNVARLPVVSSVLSSLNSSTVSHNTTPGLGGGLNNQGCASNIINSTFSYNLTCVAVPGSGECEAGANPTGAGGGIYNDVNAILLQLTENTFWANRSYQGGAIYNEASVGIVLMNNNTIANNFAQMNGGGIYNSPSTSAVIDQFVSNLVADNTDFDVDDAPDIYNISPASIFAPPFNTNPPTAPIIEGFNLVGDCGTAGQCGLTNDVNFDIIGGSVTMSANIPPRLHHLRNNGGPTETVALFPDSPAVNNGFNNLALTYDQRGPNFFRTVAQTDIGSYEYQYDFLLDIDN